MKQLREHIRKEIKKLAEELGMRKYPLPTEIKTTLERDLKLRPLIRYVNNAKAANTIPPSYRIFLHNGQDFDIIYLGDQLNNFKVRISDKEYDLLVMDDKNLAIDALNRLLTAPLPPNFGGEEEPTDTGAGDTGGTTGGGGGGQAAFPGSEPEEDEGMEGDEEPAEAEPESDMI